MGKRLFKILWILIFAWIALSFLGTVAMAFSERDEYDLNKQIMREHDRYREMHGTYGLRLPPDIEEFEDEFEKRLFSNQSLNFLLTKRQILDFLVYALAPLGGLMLLQYIVLGTPNPRSSFRHRTSPE